MEYKSFYKTVGGGEGDRCHYSTRLDTYGRGCSHDCSYCYAKSLLEFRGLWNPSDPAVADIEKIKRKLNKIPEGKILRLGGMTDCFQPVERLHRVTYETIKALNERRIGYLIVTKSAMVADDDYLEILDKDLAHIQVTVTTLDDSLAASYEKASPPSERIKAILKLQEQGFDVAIRLSPLIPGYMDIDKLNSFGINKAVVEFLRVNAFISKWFEVNTADYPLKVGGYRHMELEAKKDLIAKLSFPEITVCEDVPEHYQYWIDNVNHNPDDCCNLRK